jgi:hypothetical protein
MVHVAMYASVFNLAAGRSGAGARRTGSVNKEGWR